MAEPAGISLGEWLALGGSVVLSALGGALGGMKYGKAQLQLQIGRLGDTMNDHATELAVLKTCQANTEERLSEIRETTRDTNQEIKQLNQNLTQILLAMNNAKPGHES